MGRLNVSRIHIQNILGIESLEIEPERLTLIQGRNGSGKSSVLEAIKAALSGGHDATLIRNGADRGEVVLILEDGTEITKRITPARSTVSVRHPEFGAIGATSGYLQGLTDVLGLNPVAFLTAPPKKRTEYLLEALPLEVSADDLQNAVGKIHDVEEGDYAGHALEVIEKIRAPIYERRTGINRAAKEKRATVNQLFEGLPTEPANPDWLAEQIRGTEISEDEVLRAATAEVEDHRATMEEAMAEARRVFEKHKEQIRADNAPVIDGLKEQRAALQEQLRTAERDNKTLSVAQRMVEEAAELEKDASQHTEALSRLDALKARLLEALPIPGVEIRDGDIYCGGVTFERLNTAERVRIAVQLAALRSGSLGLVCVDGLECLDSDTFGAFQEWARSSDVQLVMTRVADRDLTVSPVAGDGSPLPF